ncbi:adhesive plaque matrix protein-like isoform X16 [Notolabrus celidotus]|uniref:adhesive plaque matrix protein-like isoform X16 n=1 Tax=Notolabrus celidotus TaxID=1203425 RepID=UPI00149081BB|nr:adhesive plaque matrix protein-like isoform X16 [Notolabrus celidotus]
MMRKRKSTSVCLAATVIFSCYLMQTIDCFRFKKTERREGQGEVDAAKTAAFQEGRILFGRVLEKGSGLESQVIDGSKRASSNVSAEDDAAFQADSPGWSQGYMQDAHEREASWRRMSPSLQCGRDQLRFRAMGPGVSQFAVEQGNAPPMPLPQVPSTCGYRMQRNPFGLVMMVPYDGCNVIQEGGNYMLPMRWQGNPVSLWCPKPAVPSYPQMPAHPPSYPQMPANPPSYPQMPAHPPSYPQMPAHPPSYPQMPAHPPSYPQMPAHPPSYPQMPAQPPHIKTPDMPNPNFPPSYFYPQYPPYPSYPGPTKAPMTPAAPHQMFQYPYYPMYYPHFKWPPQTTAAPTTHSTATTSAQPTTTQSSTTETTTKSTTKPPPPQLPPYMPFYPPYPPFFPPFVPPFPTPKPETTTSTTTTKAPDPANPTLPPPPAGYPPLPPHYHPHRHNPPFPFMPFPPNYPPPFPRPG